MGSRRYPHLADSYNIQNAWWRWLLRMADRLLSSLLVYLVYHLLTPIQMTDTSTIIIKKGKRGYYFVLINAQNKKIVGMSAQYYEDPLIMIGNIKYLSWKMNGVVYVDKRGEYRWRVSEILDKFVILKSEGYTQKHNAIDGFNSAKSAIQIGLVSCIACENSDIISLADMPAAAIERNWFNEES